MGGMGRNACVFTCQIRGSLLQREKVIPSQAQSAFGKV